MQRKKDNYCDRCVTTNPMHMPKKRVTLCRRGYDMLLPNSHMLAFMIEESVITPHQITPISSHLSNATPREDDGYSFCNAFIAFAIAKLDLAITCRLSLVTSGSACISLSLSACSLNSR